MYDNAGNLSAYGYCCYLMLGKKTGFLTKKFD